MPASALRERLASLGGGSRPRPEPRPERRLPAGFEAVATPYGPAAVRAEIVEPGRRTPRAAVYAHGSRTGFGYLDTETTGLAGGTGTYVFAAALARPVPAGIELLQFFLTEPGREPAFLHALWTEMSACRAIATYNGAAFDLPLLRTRWVLARMPGEPDHPEHWDLLTSTRALWRHRLDSCTLRSVEERLLDFEREEDLPGALIPETYLGYLRAGWHPDLEPALAHNRQDVVSLYHLHLRVERRLEGHDAYMDAADWLALGRHLFRRGRRAAGWRALRCAAELREGEASASAGLLLARRLARLRHPDSAERLLEWIHTAIPAHVDLVTARAKLLEWRLRRPGPALQLVEEALLGPPAGAGARADLERRAERLRRRVARGRISG